MSTAFELNFQRLYEIDITPEGATRTYVRLAAGLMSADPALNEETDQTKYLDGDGFGQTDVIGKQLTIAFSGHRVHGDPAQDYIFALEGEVGDSLKTNFRTYDKFGNLKSGAVTIANVDSGGGDAGAKVEVAFEIHFNGKPSVTPKSAATALSAVVAAGSATGTTKFTATAGAGNTLAYKLLSATVGTVYGMSYLDNYTAYTSGANIVAAAGQFLCMYEIDANKRVVKFLEQELDSGDIGA